jgi:hypothetical protein
MLYDAGQVVTGRVEVGRVLQASRERGTDPHPASTITVQQY